MWASRAPIQGIILYKGPSQIDGQPIVAILTGLHRPSRNSKTGQMAQVYILRADKEPVDAMLRGQDLSICGNCPHRHSNLGSCYVNVGQAPHTVWHAYHRGSYHQGTPGLLRALRGTAVRFGAYGDPAAVPYRVWTPILKVVNRWTGYTHLWRECHWRYRQFLMASCDSVIEQAEAVDRGWRTFRIRLPNEPLLPGETICPASTENGKKTTCERCCACCGTWVNRSRRSRNIAIIVHGAWASRFSNYDR